MKHLENQFNSLKEQCNLLKVEERLPLKKLHQDNSMRVIKFIEDKKRINAQGFYRVHNIKMFNIQQVILNKYHRIYIHTPFAEIDHLHINSKAVDIESTDSSGVGLVLGYARAAEYRRPSDNSISYTLSPIPRPLFLQFSLLQQVIAFGNAKSIDEKLFYLEVAIDKFLDFLTSITELQGLDRLVVNRLNYELLYFIYSSIEDLKASTALQIYKKQRSLTKKKTKGFQKVIY